MTRCASTWWLDHSSQRLRCAHSSGPSPAANERKRSSLPRSISRTDIEVLLQKRGLVGENLADERRMVNREMVRVIVPGNAARRPASGQFGVTGVHQVLA